MLFTIPMLCFCRYYSFAQYFSFWLFQGGSSIRILCLYIRLWFHMWCLCCPYVFPHFLFFLCLGRAVLRDCSISMVSLLILLPRKGHTHEPLPSRGTESRRTKKQSITSDNCTLTIYNKEELQQRKCLGTQSRKNIGGLYLVLPDRNLAVKSDAARI